MTGLMDPMLAARALSAATEINSTALSGDEPGAVLDTVVARAAELADADLGLAMVTADDGRVVVEAAHYAERRANTTGEVSGPGDLSESEAGSGLGGDSQGSPVAGATGGASDSSRADGSRASESRERGSGLDGGSQELPGAGSGSPVARATGGASGLGRTDGLRGSESGSRTAGGAQARPVTAGREGLSVADATADVSDSGRADGSSGQSGTADPAGAPGSGAPKAWIESLRGLSLSADSAAGRVARGAEPVASADFTTDPRTAPYVPDELRDYGPFAAAPFGSGGRVLGSLTVYRKRGREPFSAGTVEMLVAFAAQAGVVLALAEGANARHRVALYEERERIARELHDVIVQRLYGAGMQLDRVRRNMRKRFAQADGARLSDAIDQLDQTIEEIRGTVRALRSPEPRHDTGTPTDLAESARGEVRIAGELLGYPPTLELSGEFADIRAERADHIRAALREALSNVVRHSGASETRVTLTRDSQGVKLRVRDNGSGVPQGVATRGLRHLAERADAAGGKFFLNSSPSLGTLVAFDLPLD